MADPINNETVTLELEFAASSRLDLTEEWIAYLTSTDVPSCVDGVDPSLDEGGDDNTAIA